LRLVLHFSNVKGKRRRLLVQGDDNRKRIRKLDLGHDKDKGKGKEELHPVPYPRQQVPQQDPQMVSQIPLSPAVLKDLKQTNQFFKTFHYQKINENAKDNLILKKSRQKILRKRTQMDIRLQSHTLPVAQNRTKP
jgi:hypothetical protein